MRLFEYLPPQIYNKEAHVVDLQGAFDEQVQRLWAARDDFAAQLLLQTATWGLDFWERALGLPVDRTQTHEARRARVLARFAGMRTTTEEVVRVLACQMTGLAAVLEVIPEEYRFLLRFPSSSQGLPSIWALREALEEIKPAHLAYLLVLYFDALHRVVLRLESRFMVRFTHTVFRLHVVTLDGKWMLGGMQPLNGGYDWRGIVMRGARMAKAAMQTHHAAAPLPRAWVTQDRRWHLDGRSLLSGARNLRAELTEEAL